MHGVNQKVFELLKKNNLTISFCESASAGALSSLLCEVEGISQVFKGSIISYSNEIKNKVVKIDQNILNKYGAVSEITAELMAKNTAKIMNTDICISITGNAGSNVIENKEPCLYYVGIFIIDRTEIFEVRLENKERNFNRYNIAHYALSKLLDFFK